MTRQNINTGSVANDKTGDTLRVAGNKINANFVELYTLLGGDSSAATNKVQFADSGVQYNGLTHNSVIGVVEGNQKNTYLLGDSEGTVTINTATQTLTNKTLTSPVLTTPQINDTSADHQYVVAVAELAADRNVNLPLLTDSDTFVFQAHSQTLTNKTITSPIINTPRLVGTVSDTNGAEMIEITATGSAANHFSITNASTGNPATLAAVGSDSDVALGLQGKNRGPVQFRSAQQYLVQDITSTSQAIILERVLTKFEAGGAIVASLANSVFVGQHKVLANNGSGNVVVTPATFKNGTSITIRPKGVAQLLWIDNTDGWMIMGPKEYDSSDAAALYFITA